MSIEMAGFTGRAGSDLPSGSPRNAARFLEGDLGRALFAVGGAPVYPGEATELRLADEVGYTEISCDKEKVGHTEIRCEKEKVGHTEIRCDEEKVGRTEIRCDEDKDKEVGNTEISCTEIRCS